MISKGAFVVGATLLLGACVMLLATLAGYQNFFLEERERCELAPKTAADSGNQSWIGGGGGGGGGAERGGGLNFDPFQAPEDDNSCRSYKTTTNQIRTQIPEAPPIPLPPEDNTATTGPGGEAWLQECPKSNLTTPERRRRQVSGANLLTEVFKEWRYEWLSGIVIVSAILLRKYDYQTRQSVSLLRFVIFDCLIGRVQFIALAAEYVSRKVLEVVGSPEGEHAFGKGTFGLIVSAVCEYFLKRELGAYVYTSLLQEIVLNGILTNVLRHFLGQTELVSLLKPNLFILTEWLNRRDLDVKVILFHVVLFNFVLILKGIKYVIAFALG